MDGIAVNHRCCYCQDGGRVRDPWQFGMTVLCSRCSGGSTMAAEVRPPEERMMLPAKFRGAAFDQWQPVNGSPRVRCVGYTAEWPPSRPLLVLSGNKGTGKTTLACAILRTMFERHEVRGQFWPVIDLLDRYRRTFDTDRATETLDEVDQQMHRVALLVLDDYGAHKGSEFAEERLFALIDYRYRELRPTVITANVGLMEMADRVRSRFTDTAVCTIVNFAGPDMRPGAA
ncbi:MAG: ATP-binding protein [Gemmatimonadaceae bacterium]|nr:ATP-binding protein [Gemmatimonadaceae bacterium]